MNDCVSANRPTKNGPSRAPAHVKGRLDLTQAPSVMESIAATWRGMDPAAQYREKLRVAVARVGAERRDHGLWRVPGYEPLTSSQVMSLAGVL